MLVRYLWQYRGKPGANWFLASLSAQTLWSLAYGVALLTYAQPVRWALEGLSWAAMAGTGVYFLAFALPWTDFAVIPVHGVAGATCDMRLWALLTATSPSTRPTGRPRR